MPTPVAVNFDFMKKNGYIAFTSILIVSAVALLISVSMSILGIDEAKSSLTYKKGQETLKIAEGCLEEALIRIRDDVFYTSGSLNLPDGSCTINVSANGSEKTIDIVAVISGNPGYEKHLLVLTEFSAGDVVIKSWQEIP